MLPYTMKEYVAAAKLMGSAFEFIITADSDESGKIFLQDCIAEVKRIERLLTEFDDNSETALINRNAGINPVEVSAETYDLLHRSVELSKLTNSSFDITSGILKKLYNFKNEIFEMPSSEKIIDCLKRTGFRKISLLGNNKVYLQKSGMHIGFGAIGKGYAADKTKSLMKKKGVMSGVINASGDLSVWGTKPDGEPWKIGIANPDNIDEIVLWLPLNNFSIATSGNSEQYFEMNGKRYSHNINPKTGMPVTEIKSVSVMSPTAELCDALATAVTVLGVKDGLNLINNLPQTHCIIFDEQNNVHFSKKIQCATAKNFSYEN